MKGSVADAVKRDARDSPMHPPSSVHIKLVQSFFQHLRMLLLGARVRLPPRNMRALIRQYKYYFKRRM